ncbi:MAG TPA: 50S ribosomal protein L6 [Gammaproteobacteria bacterium]|nr:50S ribosomal protein L6 [Gammaproteobacteria bacterium]
MSRLANKPLILPKGVTLQSHADFVEVKGPKKTVKIRLHEGITIAAENSNIFVKCEKGDQKVLLGTVWANLRNTLVGVSEGFKLHLVLVGVGYRVQIQGHKLNLTLGFSHPVVYELPKEVTAESPSQTEIVLSSHDNQLLGQVAAEIRLYRMPECYKGKGIKFMGEVIHLKEVKKK